MVNYLNKQRQHTSSTSKVSRSETEENLIHGKHTNALHDVEYSPTMSTDTILHLQRTIGNQAVQRLIQSKEDQSVDSKNTPQPFSWISKKKAKLSSSAVQRQETEDGGHGNGCDCGTCGGGKVMRHVDEALVANDNKYDMSDSQSDSYVDSQQHSPQFNALVQRCGDDEHHHKVKVGIGNIQRDASGAHTSGCGCASCSGSGKVMRHVDEALVDDDNKYDMSDSQSDSYVDSQQHSPQFNALVQRHGDDEHHHKPKVEGEECVEEEAEKSKVLQRQVIQRDDKTKTPTIPSGPAWVKRKTVVPNFVLNKPAPIRSNTASSTTQAATASLPVTFTGHAAVDAKKKVWRYELDTVESKGKIQIVYYTADRYPAPTPLDDSGPLTNVTETNWKAIVKDLKKNRKGIADHWSAYLAEDLHEDYHWKNEWQKIATAAMNKVQKSLAKLSVGFDKAATASDAEALLRPQAETKFDAAIKAARKKWMKMSDSPGAKPYVAQAPALDNLRTRVKEHAKTKGWDKKKK